MGVTSLSCPGITLSPPELSRRCCPDPDSSQRMKLMKSTSEKFPVMSCRKSVCTSLTRLGTLTPPLKFPSSPSHQRSLSSPYGRQLSRLLNIVFQQLFCFADCIPLI